VPKPRVLGAEPAEPPWSGPQSGGAASLIPPGRAREREAFIPSMKGMSSALQGRDRIEAEGGLRGDRAVHPSSCRVSLEQT
jgi:hypothetical protein